MEQFYKIYKWVLKADLLPAEKLLLTLLHSLSEQTGMCMASNEWLAKEMNVTKRWIMTMLASLEKKGFIIRSKDKRREIIPVEKSILVLSGVIEG